MNASSIALRKERDVAFAIRLLVLKLVEPQRTRLQRSNVSYANPTACETARSYPAEPWLNASMTLPAERPPHHLIPAIADQL